MTSTSGPDDLFAALPPQERDQIVGSCQRVWLTQDEIVAKPGALITHVFFPVDSFISLQAEADGRDALAVDLIGSEGMLGASLLLGGARAPLRARVQGSGNALRMTVGDFHAVCSQSPVLEQRLLRQLYRTVVQVAQTAACASHHVVERRLACWLLMSHDRAHKDHFYLTHDRLARMLGVRRSGVTTAAGLLQARNLIDYARGHVVILDRQGLVEAACSCFQAVGDARQFMQSSFDEPAPMPAGIAAYHAPRREPLPTELLSAERRRPQSGNRLPEAARRSFGGANNRH